MIRKHVVLAACLAASMAAGCGGESPDDYKDFELLNAAVCDPSAGGFSAEVTNPYFPLPVGQVTALEGGGARVQITVLDQTEEVAGVETRVVEESEWEDGEQVEISRNFFAQASDGTVCYFGEDVDEYDGGSVVAHGGAWRAGGANKPGIQMPADPRVGVKFAQESAPGIAEDMSAITDLGKAVDTPAGQFTDTVRMFDWNPLQPDESGDEKYYARAVGLIVDEEAKLTQAP